MDNEYFDVSRLVPSSPSLSPSQDYLLSQAKAGPWAYHSQLVSDQDPHDTVEFAVYAQCLNHLTKEIPYELRIEVADYEHDPNTDSVYANVSLLCHSERQLVSGQGIHGNRFLFLFCL